MNSRVIQQLDNEVNDTLHKSGAMITAIVKAAVETDWKEWVEDYVLRLRSRLLLNKKCIINVFVIMLPLAFAL